MRIFFHCLFHFIFKTSFSFDLAIVCPALIFTLFKGNAVFSLYNFMLALDLKWYLI